MFLDINMPEMDGFEFLKKFQQIDNPRKAFVKIYILTSSDSSIDKEESKKYPIAGYIVKPLTVEKLENIVQGISQ